MKGIKISDNAYKELGKISRKQGFNSYRETIDFLVYADSLEKKIRSIIKDELKKAFYGKKKS